MSRFVFRYKELIKLIHLIHSRFFAIAKTDSNQLLLDKILIFQTLTLMRTLMKIPNLLMPLNLKLKLKQSQDLLELLLDQMNFNHTEILLNL